VNLPKDFNKRVFVVFKAEEISEPLIMIYRYLSLMVHLESDMLTVSPTELHYMTSGREVWKSPLSYENFYEYLRKCFIEVVERDDLVRQFFHCDFTKESNLVVEVIHPKEKI